MNIRVEELKRIQEEQTDLEDLLKERFSLQIMIILLQYGKEGASLRKIMSIIGPSKYRSIKNTLEKLQKMGMVTVEVVKYPINDGYNYKLTEKGKKVLNNLLLLIRSLMHPEGTSDII